MIGTQPTGAIEGVQISAVSHEGLKVIIDGKPGYLAIITAEGEVVASGKSVSQEAAAVAINCYRNFLLGKGFLKILSNPISKTKNHESKIDPTSI